MPKRSHCKPQAIFHFGSLALLGCLAASAAELGGAEQEICHEVESAINVVMDETQTTCMYSAEKADALSFRVTSSEPVLANAKKKKEWIVGVAAAVGKVMNSHRTTKVDELWLADAKQEKRGIGYVIPVSVAKSLQRSVDDGKINLEQMYAVIKKELDRKKTDK